MSEATRDAIILFWVALLSIAGAVGVQELLHRALVRIGRPASPRSSWAGTSP